MLDLFCGAGGASMGYHRAGFEVVGVDIEPQPRYPFQFVQADVLSLRRDVFEGCWHTPGPASVCLGHFDAVHASPPCLDWTSLAAMTGGNGTGWMLDATRTMIAEVGVPYVIENVPGAPLLHGLRLCGTEFGLRAIDHDGETVALRRHRYFESNVFLMGAGGCQHTAGVRWAGVYGGNNNGPKRGRNCGYVPRIDVRRKLMGIDWMIRREINLAIPPAYTQHLGEQLMALIAQPSTTHRED
ncbi:MAG: hypothetical protein QM582_09480 [Micropruina sp.]|uniref:hypothetical protein n=1 Tax=Micropruina sp. TaxID=2737536 RepID=UPI0039E32844